MTLKAQLIDDMKIAMKAKDSNQLSTIRLVNAEIKQFEVDEQIEANDAKVIAIIMKMIKQRKDSVKIYAEAGRDDLAAKENMEITVLQKYLPAMLSEEEIVHEVQAVIDTIGAVGIADMGKAMSVLKNKLTGKADMAVVSKVLKATLSK